MRIKGRLTATEIDEIEQRIVGFEEPFDALGGSVVRPLDVLEVDNSLPQDSESKFTEHIDKLESMIPRMP